MSGIYIHIPFCKQACYYCNFHFSTSMKKKSEMITCLVKEIELRKSELNKDIIETIYFGGGTPSVLSVAEIQFVIDAVYENFTVDNDVEITLEANPDDLSEEKIIELSKSPVNRLSIGIQSFFEHDLKLMNRAHNATEAKKCLLRKQYDLPPKHRPGYSNWFDVINGRPLGGLGSNSRSTAQFLPGNLH